jgi:hypothetical protein
LATELASRETEQLIHDHSHSMTNARCAYS